jgi:glycosyltransferase involved in cell wall biosynthesis
LTVALDATYSVGDALSGVGAYSHHLLHGIAAAHPETRFAFYYRSHRFLRSFRETMPRNAARRLLAEPWGPRRADLFHGLNQRLPQMRLRRCAATFHDLFVMTGEYSTPDFRSRFTAQARDAAGRADAVIAVSEFTRGQVVALLGIEPARVHVVHHGVDIPALPPVCRERVVLSLGALQKRKNVERLVEAFEAVDPSWRLVLAGSCGFGAEGILERIARSPVRDRITVTGYVSREDRNLWYARASVFAFPSLDEGFGMPVLEAMAAGIPVLTSNRSALPEVAGDAAVLVDPERTENIAEALRSLTGDGALREVLSQKGRLRAARFTWDKACGQTWRIYQKLLQ